MNFIIHTQDKRFNLLELILIIGAITLATYCVTSYISPKTKIFEQNDNTRESHLNIIKGGIVKYYESGATELDNNAIIDCVDGYSLIGKGQDEIDLEKYLNDFIDKSSLDTSFPKDPNKTTSDPSTGYQICKSLDGGRFELHASLSELEPDITLGVRIREIQQEENIQPQEEQQL